MSDMMSTHGRAFANDAQYDNLSGRVTYNHEVVGMTLDGWKVRHTVRYIDIGRAEPVTPADPEAFLESPGPFPLRKFKKQGKTDEFEAEVYALLRKRPLNATEIAEAIGCTVNRAKGLVRNHPEGFEILARGNTGCIYGIPGHQYTEPVYHKGMGRIAAFLREFGPQTATTICEGLGIFAETFIAARDANPGVLEVTGWAESRGTSRRLIRVWGVVNALR